MWTCPACGRTFRNTNQSHYCGEKPRTIDEYILAQDETRQPDLWEMKRILNQALPDAEEHIAWSMPTLRKGHTICHFAASKQHIGYYVGSAAVEQFAHRLTPYKTNKGTIRIPYGKLDPQLIGDIAAWCAATGNHP